MNRGFAALNNKFNQEFSGIEDFGGLVSSVRVVDIVLDNQHPKFSDYGGWNGIGTINFEEVSINSFEKKDLGVATPLLPFLKNYPLINEIVLIFTLPSRDIGGGNDAPNFYYLNPISIWNHPHHNAYPSSTKVDDLPDSSQKDYQLIEAGSVRRVSDESTDINLNSPTAPIGSNGGIFIEELDVYPLLPFSGDNIFEGRFGNSIRLGSTSKTSNILYSNNWSNFGKNGSPVTVIRNGEDANNDNEG